MQIKTRKSDEKRKKASKKLDEAAKMPVFTGILRTPPEALLRSKVFLRPMMEFYNKLGLSGDQTLDFVLLQIYYGRSGELYDYEGLVINVEAWMVHTHFASEPRRWINSSKKWPEEPAKQKVQKRLIERVMAMYLAMLIFKEREKLELERKKREAERK